MNTSRIGLSLAALIAVGLTPALAAAPVGTLVIDPAVSKAVAPIRYGFHYEEIGMMGDGGLYAELVRNRAFEEAMQPRGLKIENGVYVGIDHPIPAKRAFETTDPLVGWQVRPGAAGLALDWTDAHPLNPQNPHSMRVTAAGAAPAAFENVGFFGMNFKPGVPCRLSFFARADAFAGLLSIALSDGKGNAISQPFAVEALPPGWKQYRAELTPTVAAERGALLFTVRGQGSFQLDVVSLLPGDTWNGGQSVFRADILKNLADYAPDFIRFPGGCIVHGVSVESMYYWKETIGPIEQRPGAWSKWQPHYRTDGLGYHEFYELCEALGADAMYVAPSGLVCSGWVPGRNGAYNHAPVDVRDYVRNTLDAIEYAIGPVDTPWGARRAANGHPAPFPLKYLQIGNEDFGPDYYRNFHAIASAVRERYPDLILVADSVIGKAMDDKRTDLPLFKDLSLMDLFDEHYYQDIPWAVRSFRKFDAYDRNGPDLYIGELGINGPYPKNLLAEGITMMGLERNADLNPLIADRPVMRNWDFIERRRVAPLYLHDASRSVKTFNFFLSKLFRDHRPDRFVEPRWEPAGGKFSPYEKSVFATAGIETAQGRMVLKLINLLERPLEIGLRIGEGTDKPAATITTLTARPDQYNTPETPEAVLPQTVQTDLDLHGSLTLKASSLTVVTFPAPTGL
jgi:hypothetical protein